MDNNINEQKIDYSVDARLVISELEAVHPIFLLNEVPASYEKNKAEYLEFTSKAITFTEFRLATQKCLAILGDGHIIAGLACNSNPLYIDIDWIANDGKLYLLDERKKPTDVEIVSISGVPVNKITEQVDIYYTAENEAAKQNNYTIYCRREDMFLLAGCSYTDSGIELQTSDGRTIICDACSGTLTIKRENYIIRHEMLGDVFYIDLRQFREDSSVDEMAEQIENAVDNGTKKFIIDVRDNYGGNSDVGEQLLQAMGMTAPDYGMFMRHSKLSQEQMSYKSDDKSFIWQPDASKAVPNENIILLVLTNVETFSSATMLGVWVQDGKLGKVVGQISSNKPNAYGEMLSIKLPVSKINFNISCKRFLRPDINANPDSLIPDIEVPFGDDILTAALDYMSLI